MPQEPTSTRPHRLPARLLVTATLTLVACGLLAPSAAPASRRAAQASETAAPPSSPPQTGTGEETPATTEATTIAPVVPAEDPTTTVPSEEVVTRPSRPARGERPLGRHNGCRIGIAIISARLNAGESATATGTLACQTPAEAAAQTVTLYNRAAHTHGFSAVATATTEADGSYTLSTGAIEANSVFYAGVDGARSSRATVKVAASVSISGPPEGSQLLTAGRRFAANGRASGVTFSGTVSPDDEGARVVLQRQGAHGNEGWRRIGLGTVGEDGKYSITHAFATPGDVNIRIIVRSHGGNLPGISEPLSYEISQRQNPLLSIVASTDPITAGAPVTISGKAVDAAAAPLTLLARTRGDAFAEVATTTTDAEGNYSFPTQTPSVTTFYKVKSAATSSAVLAEGVRPVLTATVTAAAVPATSVAAGAPLTFSGTVSPSHAGQTVYLERQNPSGIGFQVLALGAVGADSSYSISYVPLATGAELFRVKVAGNAANQSALSELLNIEVTPGAPTAPEEVTATVIPPTGG